MTKTDFEKKKTKKTIIFFFSLHGLGCSAILLEVFSHIDHVGKQSVLHGLLHLCIERENFLLHNQDLGDQPFHGFEEDGK